MCSSSLTPSLSAAPRALDQHPCRQVIRGEGADRWRYQRVSAPAFDELDAHCQESLCLGPVPHHAEGVRRRIERRWIVHPVLDHLLRHDSPSAQFRRGTGRRVGMHVDVAHRRDAGAQGVPDTQLGRSVLETVVEGGGERKDHLIERLADVGLVDERPVDVVGDVGVRIHEAREQQSILRGDTALRP